jgi:hypothetical protein
MMTDARRYMSGLAEAHKTLENKAISPTGLAESWARQKATRHEDERGVPTEPLGQPISIRAVASMLGCSSWTVRQRHIPDGLPHFRSGPNGKLIFFRDQVVAWILHQQRKGGRL